MSRRIDDETRRQAHAMSERGESLRSIGDALGVSHTTIQRILAEPPPPESSPNSGARGELVSELVALATVLEKGGRAWARQAKTCRAAAEALTEPPPQEEEEPLPEIAFDETAPALEVARSLVQAQRVAHAEAVRRGDDRAAQHAARTVQGALGALARLERAAAAESDMVQFPRSVMVAAAASYRKRVAKILGQPLTCARCGAELRARMAGVELGPSEGEAQKGPGA